MREASPRWRVAARRRWPPRWLTRARRRRTSTRARAIITIVIRRLSGVVDEIVVAVIAGARGAIVGIIGRIPFGRPAQTVDESAYGMVSLFPFGAAWIRADAVPLDTEDGSLRSWESVDAVVEVGAGEVGKTQHVVLAIPSSSGHDFPAQEDSRDSPGGTFR